MAVTGNIDDRSGIRAGKYQRVVCGVLMFIQETWISILIIQLSDSTSCTRAPEYSQELQITAGQVWRTPEMVQRQKITPLLQPSALL